MPKEDPIQTKLAALVRQIDTWASELGFQQVGIADTDLSAAEAGYREWLEKNYYGTMNWMVENSEKRLHPEQLHEGTVRIICVRMNYLPPDTDQITVLKTPEKAYVSRYALGRDYHKVIRKRLSTLAKSIEQYCAEHGITPSANQRPFVDSAPVLERPLAQKAGLGSTGKHTLLINEQDGSWFFLGEIFTNIPLPVSAPHLSLAAPKDICGDCNACLKVCPTDAFPKPYQLDARRCISYLTIEHKGAIPEEFREPMGNRVYGCDDCQAICPWNKYAQFTEETDFHPRHQLDSSELLTLFAWTEQEFLDRTAGSPIRRIGYLRWLRNLSVGLGNAPTQSEIQHALLKALESLPREWLDDEEAGLREHLTWALEQQANPNRRRKRKITNPESTLTKKKR